MWRPALKILAATALFGVVHSAFASGQAKRAAAAILGRRTANGVYRIFYIAQSFVTAGVLVQYIRRQPSFELYHVRGRLALLMHAGQAAALSHATQAASQVGILRITGLENWWAWNSGQPVSPMPEAQGPGFDQAAMARASGPFALSRHPLNFSPLPILWLWPRMNSNLLAFNVAATCYLIMGSRHEELRLLEVNGKDYEKYRASGVPFYWPSPNPNYLRPITALLPATADDDEP